MDSKIKFDRRNFFKGVFLEARKKAKEYTLFATNNLAPCEYFRPPGAVDEIAFLTLCTRCDKCIEICPHHTLKRVVEENPSKHTPKISFGETPCYLCKDLPCITACKNEALITPKTLEEVNIGEAEIITENCIAYNKNQNSLIESDCKICYDICPLKNKAIILKDNKPKITKSCVGCGLCFYNCPTLPKAINIFFPKNNNPENNIFKLFNFKVNLLKFFTD